MSLCFRPLQILLVVPGVPMNGNEFLDLCALIIAGTIQTPLLQQKRPEINPELFRPHTTTCMDKGENDASIPGMDASQLERHVKNLRNWLKTVQAARREASDSNSHCRGSPGGKGKTRPSLGRQRAPSSARDQRHHDDRPVQVVGRAQPGNAEVRTCKQSWTKRKACRVCHACNQLGHWAGDPQCPGRHVDMIELEDEVREFERNQDTGMRQVLSVQVDVSEVRSLRPSTRLCARNEFHGCWTKGGSPRCH